MPVWFTITERHLYQVGMFLPTLQLEKLMLKEVSSGSCSGTDLRSRLQTTRSLTWEERGALPREGCRGGLGAPAATLTLGPWV